jgi:hypothetical protein
MHPLGKQFVVLALVISLTTIIGTEFGRSRDSIHNAYMRTIEGGTEGRDVLTRIARQLPVDAIALAGTDLSVIFDETNTDFPSIARRSIFRRLYEPSARTNSLASDLD